MESQASFAEWLETERPQPPGRRRQLLQRESGAILRSGLTPAMTFRQVTGVEPIHGVISNTTRQSNAHGPTTATNRARERPPSGGRDDVVAAAVRPLEDSGGDFKDFIKMLRRQDVFGRAVRHKESSTYGDHAMRVPRREIHIMRHTHDGHLPLRIQTFEDIVELNLMLQVEIHCRLVKQEYLRILRERAGKHGALPFATAQLAEYFLR